MAFIWHLKFFNKYSFPPQSCKRGSSNSCEKTGYITSLKQIMWMLLRGENIPRCGYIFFFPILLGKEEGGGNALLLMGAECR